MLNQLKRHSFVLWKWKEEMKKKLHALQKHQNAANLTIKPRFHALGAKTNGKHKIESSRRFRFSMHLWL